MTSLDRKHAILQYHQGSIFAIGESASFDSRAQPYYFIQIQCRGERHAVSLETSNPDAAAARARTLYEQVRANGWESTLDARRPQRGAATGGIIDVNNVTLGAYIAAAKATADIAPRTLETYCQAVRKIASDMLHLPADNTRYDKIGGGREAWVNKVATFKLSGFTPAKIAAWKKGYLESAKSDPVSQRAARVSVAYYLRNAKSLFSAKIRAHIVGLTFPDPLPFSGVQIERPSAKYFATFDLAELIQSACDNLAETDQEGVQGTATVIDGRSAPKRNRPITVVSVSLERQYHLRRTHASFHPEDPRQRR
jgi:hypothetical protein